MKALENKTIYIIIGLFSLVLLLIASTVNFMQNDDWVHYRTVERFLAGDFSLEPLIGSTFYVQGFIAYVFSLIFGIKHLPILTMIVSIMNMVVFAMILRNKTNIKPIYIALAGLLFFFNPLHFYSSIGFMNDNFVLFFVLLAVFFVEKFISENYTKWFIAINASLLLGFFIKQYVLVFFASFIILLLLKKLYKYATYETLIFIGLMMFYYLVFPRTGIMLAQEPLISNILDFGYTFSFLMAVIVYMGSFIIPISIYIIYALYNNIKVQKKSVFILFFGICALLVFEYVLFAKYNELVHDFPYLINVFTRKGFFSYGLQGNKYHWAGFYDLFQLWPIIGYASITIMAAWLIILKKIKVDYVFISFIVYFVLVFFTKNTYDRYLLPLIPFVLIYVLGIKDINFNSKVFGTLVSAFLVFFVLINYLYASDYIKWQRYITLKADQIVKETQVSNALISSSHARNKYYDVDSEAAVYFFTFDRPEVLANDTYVVEDEYEVDFPLNIFIDSKVYLYSRGK